jgi:hypothetical protein
MGVTTSNTKNQCERTTTVISEYLVAWCNSIRISNAMNQHEHEQCNGPTTTPTMEWTNNTTKNATNQQHH